MNTENRHENSTNRHVNTENRHENSTNRHVNTENQGRIQCKTGKKTALINYNV